MIELLYCSNKEVFELVIKNQEKQQLKKLHAIIMIIVDSNNANDKIQLREIQNMIY